MRFRELRTQQVFFTQRTADLKKLKPLTNALIGITNRACELRAHSLFDQGRL